MGLSVSEHAHADQDKIQGLIRQLFGPNSVSLTKCVAPCLIANILGWNVNLETELGRPSDNGIDKLVFAFVIGTDTSASISTSHWQCLASLACRYSACIRGTSPFVAPLYHMVAKSESVKRQSCDSSPDAFFCIAMWRAVAILLLFDKDCMSVPLSQMCTPSRNNAAPWYGISDASPWKLCCAIYNSQHVLVAWTTLRLPYNKDEKGLYQNNREFLGLLLTLILLHLCCPIVRGSNIIVKFVWASDNKTALSWAQKGRSNSKASQYANLAVVWFQIISKLSLTQTEWVKGESMGDIDNGSRDRATPSLSSNLYINVEAIIPVMDLFKQCDPSRSNSPINITSAFVDVARLLQSIINHAPTI